MLKLVWCAFVFGTSVYCFIPNCVTDNQYKFYSFPVEGCSKYLKELCRPIASGRFESISNPTIVKIKKTSVLPTCAFYDIDTLEHIYGVKSKIKVLAKGSFINLPNLKTISLSFNQITEVRDQIFQNVTVEKLNLSWNNILSIDPDAFKEVYNLRELDLSGNSLITIPINQLSKSISILNLAYNHLTRIAINSIKFTNLTVVNLSHNQIQNIAISFNYPIESFDLTNNKLRDIDYVEITSVKKFRIGWNNFRRTPRYLENINAINIGIYPNPWKCEELPILWSSIISLNYKVETTNPKTMAVCTNITLVSNIGSETKTCNSDHQCPTNKICKVGQCLDPCMFFCHNTSKCTSENHQFTCSCPKGTKTDPLDLTGSCNYVQCYVSLDCPRGYDCLGNKCTLPLVVGGITDTPEFTTLPIDTEEPWWFDDIPSITPTKVLNLPN